MTRIREEEDQSFVPYVKTFQAKYTTLRSPYGISRPSVSVVCDRVTLLRPTQRVNILGNSLFLQHLIAQRLGQFVINMHELEK